MAQAIAARMYGDDYQARWFWLNVCRLFQPRSKVERVVFEANNVRSLDDVAVYYRDGFGDEEGRPLRADFFQVKFHVTAAGAITSRGMKDPKFINAHSVSLLQRLHAAQRDYAPNGHECRFILYSPWAIDPIDPLAECHCQRGGRLLWSRLSAGGARSKLGRVRAAWREHLGIQTDEELATILCPLRIRQGYQLDELQRQLNMELRSAGFTPAEEGTLSNPYDDLYRKLLQAGRTSFTRGEIEEVCRENGMWTGASMPETEVYRVGIRTFIRWAEHLEDETDTFLDLTSHFNGRRILSQALWHGAIFPEVESFLATALRGRCRAVIEMHALSSIAFATGYCLPPKSGIDAAPVQPTTSGRKIWRPDLQADPSSFTSWQFTEERIHAEGGAVALAISATKPVQNDVRHYVTTALPEVGRVLCYTLPPIPSDTAVHDGTHAKFLAQYLEAHLRAQRTDTERAYPIHIFAAAPNGLLFFLGQLLHGLGRCVLYEYCFEQAPLGAYEPSFTFPPVNGASGR